LVVRVSDRGPGIRTEQLPATLFESGFSTKVSLGMGFTLMLQLADTIWLATGPEGTILQAELNVQPQVPDQKMLEKLLARF
jgi:sensor histidine kinase regulating citrate/malate metabolism